ncbi:hypothetical protein NQ318_017050 [Aromia moschata]|uniref:DDE-1 domain-containing protein n=1 Tax=Aromia moschata TaxID=1265417 RepID=A0AAV8YA54_9CUCU|nr:hypothetical protein NQ318_017050 [Aromia moschata]
MARKLLTSARTLALRTVVRFSNHNYTEIIKMEETIALVSYNFVIRAIKNDGKTIRETARTFNIPESTLRKYKSPSGRSWHQSPRLGRQPGFRRLVFRYAEANNIRHKFNREKGLAGIDWLYGFLKRTPEITLRQPEGTSLNRIASFIKEAVQTFYSNLRTLMEKIKFKAKRIFNVDETGITTVQTKCPKVYGPKGAKKVGTANSGERGRTIIGVFCVSASGNYVPPMLIYPRKRMAATLQQNGPIGASFTCSKNGWINSELFVEWLKHFEQHAYNFCKEKHIHMVSLPPHTSDNLQPLDVTFFSPLKNALYREYDIYLVTTGHQKITEYDVSELLNKAFMKVATMEKAVSGFRTSGIFPLNPDRFSEDDFCSRKSSEGFRSRR